MPTHYTDQFFTFDPANPPPVGTNVVTEKFTLTDQNDDGDIDEFDDDAVAGLDVTASWPGDTVTMELPNGDVVTYSGTTIYISDGSVIFTPTDGQVLSDGEFVSATYVTVQGPLIINELGPPCFLAGTRIMTPTGPRKVECLEPGDLVETLDRGAIPLVHACSRSYSGAEMERNPRHRPIRIPVSAFDGSGSEHTLCVSPQHRMLIRSKIAERIFGVADVLAPAAQLVGFFGITRAQDLDPVHYLHLVFDHHAIVRAEGLATESLFLSRNSIAELRREDFLAIGASLTRAQVHSMKPARKFVSGPKLKQLLGRHEKNCKPLFDAPAAQLARFIPMTRARARGSESNRAASCSVMAPASCSTSVMVTARS